MGYHVMSFFPALAVAKAGRRVRQVVWATRWLSFDGNWRLTVVNPLSRVVIERHVVRMFPETELGWSSAEWTTEEIPPGDLSEMLNPWKVPFVIEFQGLIDGSDFLNIASGRIWLTHRNWQPAAAMIIKINGGAAISWDGSPRSLEYDTSLYDRMAITKLSGRGPVTITQPWANDAGSVLIDDDDPGTMPGADTYIVRITLSWSAAG